MLLSIVVSFRNEEDVLGEFIKRLQNALAPIQIDYEILFVNDASTDRSLEILKEEARQNRHIKVINMSRNFGNAECMHAGFKYSSGDALVYIDADLQDPPELIPKMLEEFNKGVDVVYTVRLSREGESWTKRLATKIAYRVLRKTSKIDLPVDAGDYKLMSRRVVDEVVRLHEKHPMIKALVTWVGFKQVPLFYHREKRFAGGSHFPLLQGAGLRVFIMGLTAFSMLPLNVALVLGFVISFLSLVYLFGIFIMYFLGMNIPGWTALMAIVLILGSTQLLTLGFMGIYMGRIYDEVKNRPNYIVESLIGFEKS